MDSKRFDEITKELTTSTDRRTVLKRLAGGALGGLLALRGAEEAAAACKANNKECTRDGQCCSLNCRRGECRCARLQERCKSAKGCCQGGDATVCATINGLSGDRCCRELDKECNVANDCCGSLVCNDLGKCF